MEVRLRSSVSRTSKGFSVEATLDMGSEATEKHGPDKVVDLLSSFQIAKLKEHMERLGAEFPKEEA